MNLTIAEIPASIWELKPTFNLMIDRSCVTVADYLEEQKVSWVFGDSKKADICLYKNALGGLTPKRCFLEMQRRFFDRRNFLSLIGEPRELASAAYFFERPRNTLAVAPGDEFSRLYFASEWLDPRLEQWNGRFDRICWIARPTRERIAVALEMNRKGIPLDIYSRHKWPVDNWKGFAADEIATARLYKYRIVCENSSRHGYHSEKLFNSIRSGCVTFYHGDPSLDLSYLAGGFIPLTVEAVEQREDSAGETLSGMERFMFTKAWEIYSFKRFYERIILLSRELLNSHRD